MLEEPSGLYEAPSEQNLLLAEPENLLAEPQNVAPLVVAPVSISWSGSAYEC